MISLAYKLIIRGEPYWKLPPCIHVGILDFNMMESPGFYHKISLMDEKTNELYSRKFQFHVIELKKIRTTKGKARKHPLYRWARLLAATTWEEVAEESAGNQYMERIREEMVKMSQDERERYLYLREAMAESDRVSQLESAERKGIREGIRQGEIINKITLIQKKMQRGDSVEKIAEDLLEETSFVNLIYNTIREKTDQTSEEIYNLVKEEL